MLRDFVIDDGFHDADDDGVTIFWRRDKFKLTALNFLAIRDKKRNQGAVRASLERLEDGAPLIVSARTSRAARRRRTRRFE
jgi:hypothetical protein